MSSLNSSPKAQVKSQIQMPVSSQVPKPKNKSSLKSLVQMSKSGHEQIESPEQKVIVLNMIKICSLLKYRNLSYIVTGFSLRLDWWLAI